jgi:hypothetical protein
MRKFIPLKIRFTTEALRARSGGLFFRLSGDARRKAEMPIDEKNLSDEIHGTAFSCTNSRWLGTGQRICP